MRALDLASRPRSRAPTLALDGYGPLSWGRQCPEERWLETRKQSIKDGDKECWAGQRVGLEAAIQDDKLRLHGRFLVEMIRSRSDNGPKRDAVWVESDGMKGCVILVVRIVIHDVVAVSELCGIG